MTETKSLGDFFLSPKRQDKTRGLLCSAFEGGSNEWCLVVDYEYGSGVKAADFKKGGRFTDKREYWHPAQLIPFVPGCAVIIAVDDKRYRLDRDALIKGYEVMAGKYPCHYADVLTDHYDAITGDVFLQCCLFGEIVYS